MKEHIANKQLYIAFQLHFSVTIARSLVSLLITWKFNNIIKSEVSFVLLSLVALLSQQDDGIVGKTNILSDPPFHVDHSNAIY